MIIINQNLLIHFSKDVAKREKMGSDINEIWHSDDNDDDDACFDAYTNTHYSRGM